MKFRTEIQPIKTSVTITDQSQILCIGSCFSKHIGNFLKNHFITTLNNPFGTLFNPISVSRLIERSTKKDFFHENELFFHENQWKSFDLHSVFNRNSKTGFIKNINQTINQTHNFLAHSDIIIITFGTAQVFRLKENGKIVANCHKQPAGLFERDMLHIDEIIQATQKIYLSVKKFHQNTRFIFSVSPVRYLQDGMPANSRSKARLIEAIHSFVEKHPDDTVYFPAYEIFMDDLRDYRFYDMDLIHPGKQGIQYVSEIFSGTFFDKKGIEMLKETEKLYKLINHKPFRTDDKETLKLQEKIQNLIEKLQKKYPGLDLP